MAEGYKVFRCQHLPEEAYRLPAGTRVVWIPTGGARKLNWGPSLIEIQKGGSIRILNRGEMSLLLHG